MCKTKRQKAIGTLFQFACSDNIMNEKNLQHFVWPFILQIQALCKTKQLPTLIFSWLFHEWEELAGLCIAHYFANPSDVQTTLCITLYFANLSNVQDKEALYTIFQFASALTHDLIACVKPQTCIMAIRVVESSNGGYKIRKIFP